MKKIISILLALAILVVSFSGCYGDLADTDLFGVGGPYPFFRKPNNWEQYNTSDYFKFSEKEVYSHSEEVEDPDGNESILKYYYRDFGTFPIMDGMGYGKIIAFEFARQHFQGSENVLNSLSPLYPIYTLQPSESNFLNDMHEEYCLTTEGPVLISDDNKEVRLQSERPTDIIFDPSGLPIDESFLEFKSFDLFLEADIVCYDSMVFFTSVDNPVNSLTTKQIQDIYSGKITNWKDLGGDDIEIEVYHRGESTMNRDYMDNVVMKGFKTKETNYIKLKEPISYATNTFHKYPKEYQNSPQSIGYCYKSLVERFYGDDIKILNVNDIEPTDENIRSDKYSYSIPCLAYTRKDKTGALGKKVIEWLKSDEGKKSMEQIGYVPVG